VERRAKHRLSRRRQTSPVAAARRRRRTSSSPHLVVAAPRRRRTPSSPHLVAAAQGSQRDAVVQLGGSAMSGHQAADGDENTSGYGRAVVEESNLMQRAVYQFRRLHAGGLKEFRTLRLTALQDHPEAYGTAYEEESGQDLSWFGRYLQGPPGGACGCWLDTELVGIVCIFVQDRPKLRHAGLLASVYVDPAHRGTGAAGVLISGAIKAARDDGLRVLHLSVTVGNAPALALYEGLGFRRTGIHPRGLRIDGVFYDEIHMALDLD